MKAYKTDKARFQAIEANLIAHLDVLKNDHPDIKTRALWSLADKQKAIHRIVDFIMGFPLTKI